MSTEAKRYRGPLFGNVPRSLWERADLSREAKVLFAFLCSSPGGGGLAGIFRLSREDVSEILGFRKRRTDALLVELQSAGLIVAEGRWLWIVEATAMTPGFSMNNEKHERAIETALAEAPAGIAAAFRKRYPLRNKQTSSDEHGQEHGSAHSDEHSDPGTGEGTEGRRPKDGEGGKPDDLPPAPVTPSDDQAWWHEELAKTLVKRAKALAETCGWTTEAIIRAASTIEASNGHAEKSFGDPMAKGISLEWIETTLTKGLPDLQARLSRTLPL